MNLLTVILIVVIVGVIMYLVNKYVPMEAGIKRVLNIAVVVILVLWLLRAVGLFHYLSDIRI